MKKVIVVSKTHLDLGFTDFASRIKRKYIEEYIPGAISLAEQLNQNGSKKFIWTTGSWILKEALLKGDRMQRERLKKAIAQGNIVPHAMPFTTHTELLDEDTLDYGLSIADDLDKLRGRKTTAAKMTDVPGHTKALVPLLAKHGIKLLHIGVNGASALCKVPPCFLWRCGGAEVVVVYSGDYGGAFQSDLVDEVLYFDHTLDNRGTPAPSKIIGKLEKIKAEFPGYTVEAGTLDEFADVIWEKRHELPVVTSELGDTWIHGAAADPYKAAALRELTALKNEWLQSGEMVRNSEEYIGFTDNLMCIAEHTCGMDMKTYLGDYENYLKKDFENQYSRKGSIFMDYRNSPKHEKMNTVIYGHHVGDDTMFDTVEKYLDQSFYDQHKTMQYDTKYGKYQLEVISAYETTTEDDYIQTDFSSSKQYEKFLEETLKKSEISTTTEINKNDKIVTLSTCEDAYSLSSGRIVVVAKLVEI